MEAAAADFFLSSVVQFDIGKPGTSISDGKTTIDKQTTKIFLFSALQYV